MSASEFVFEVTYIDDGVVTTRLETFPVGERFAFRTGVATERALRAAIESESGDRRNVLQELYRELVLSNFTRLDTLSGETALASLDSKYPSTGCLPGFERVSGRFNTTGSILHNAKRGIGPGYRYLPAILYGLVKARIVDAPRCVTPVEMKAQ